MNDQQAIQGLWRLVSYVSRGKEIHSSATHYLYSGDREKEIVPSMVDDGRVRTVFQLDEEADPKQIVVSMDWNGPDGPPAANPLVRRGFYRLAGDNLEICFGIAGEYPASGIRPEPRYLCTEFARKKETIAWALKRSGEFW